MAGRRYLVAALAVAALVPAQAVGSTGAAHGKVTGITGYFGTTDQGLSIYVGITVFAKTEVDVEVPDPYHPGHAKEEQQYICSDPGNTTVGLPSLLFFVASLPDSGVFSLKNTGVGVKTVTGHIVGRRLTGTYSYDNGTGCTTGVVKFTALAASPAKGGGSTGSTGSTGGGGACVVPKLRGSSLHQATVLLTQAHCRLGTVTGGPAAAGATLVVVSSSPPAGAHLQSLAKVDLKVRSA